MVNKNKKKELNIVVPLYDEESCVQIFHQRLMDVLAGIHYAHKIFYVDDGSTDHTLDLLMELAKNDDHVSVIQLSRNFGHQAALSAGLDLADGDVVITMDGDGQHPPELIPTLLEKYEEGFDIVQTKRKDTGNASFYKKNTSRLFYWLINKLGNTKILPGTADFRLMNRNVVLAIRNLNEYHRFLRGLIPWLGYKTYVYEFEPQKRVAGKSKYTLGKMFNLAENAIFSFSLVPLRIGLLIGMLFFLLAFIEAVYVLTFWISGNQQHLTPGWSSTIFVILITGGALMVMISLVGIYVGQIHQEIKHRPLYIVRYVYNQKNRED
jgi:dolichol-phosphate mannosyltransferase